MASDKSQPLTCQCGQVIFDASDHKPGDTLTCAWCEKRYTLTDNNKLKLIDNDAPVGGFTVEAGSEEVFSHSPTPPEKSSKSSRDTGSKRTLPRARPRISTRVSTDSDSGEDPPPKTKRPAEIPGGIFPMIGFIVVFNALAFTALSLLFPKLDNGMRDTFWGGKIGRTSIPWPELLALFAGHITGFFGWAYYVFLLQKRMKAAALAAQEEESESATENTSRVQKSSRPVSGSSGRAASKRWPAAKPPAPKKVEHDDDEDTVDSDEIEEVSDDLEVHEDDDDNENAEEENEEGIDEDVKKAKPKPVKKQDKKKTEQKDSDKAAKK